MENNNKHKRYGLFARIFKWKQTYELIINESKELFDGELKVKDMEINSIKDISEKEREVRANELSSTQNALDGYRQLNETYQKEINELKNNINLLSSEIERLKSDNGSNATLIEELKLVRKKLESENSEKENTIGVLQNTLDNSIKSLQENVQRDQQSVMNDTRELLGIFKKTTGAAGKIAEIRLEDLISKTSLSSDRWINNLPVGTDTVEFAIRAEMEEDKWIPVDSKLVGAFTEGEIMVDDKYQKEVINRVKQVTKYLGKKNTTQFGIMVLQSDSVYNEIYDHYPETLTTAITDYSIFVMSPSAFVQFSTAINKLSNTFEKAQRASMISGELNNVIGHINKLLKAWDDGFSKLNIINNTHIKNIKSSVSKVETLNAIEYEKTIIEEDN